MRSTLLLHLWAFVYAPATVTMVFFAAIDSGSNPAARNSRLAFFQWFPFILSLYFSNVRAADATPTPTEFLRYVSQIVLEAFNTNPDFRIQPAITLVT